MLTHRRHRHAGRVILPGVAWLCGAALLGPGCAASGTDETRCASAALLGAHADTESSAVCRVVIAARDSCSATLVAPSLVLTAKHCVQPPASDAPLAASSMQVLFGADADDPELERGVAGVVTTEGAYSVDAQGALQGALLGRDLALLQLLEPVDGVAAAPLDLDGAGLAAPGPFRIVGFGTDEQGEDGVRLQREVSPSRLEPELVWIGPYACDGDSGGPMLSPSGRVVAVASAALGECGRGEVMYTRLDANAAFLEPALEQADATPSDCTSP